MKTTVGWTGAAGAVGSAATAWRVTSSGKSRVRRCARRIMILWPIRGRGARATGQGKQMDTLKILPDVGLRGR
jgi:hypothetical protein